jgi:segregation and condensation protein A
VPYQVKLEVFEGPFDLLLHLIGRREIDIYDISIAEITDEYLSYMESLRQLDLEIATEFLLIAATLLKLKSDLLLPEPEVEGEELGPSDLREELLWRLVEYQKYRNAAAELGKRLDREERYYYRLVELEEPFQHVMPDVLRGLTLERLAEAARVLIELEAQVDVSYIAPIKVNIGDFMDLTAECALRVELIVMFLALLELYKREEIDIRQAARFGDIEVYATGEVAHGI